ncbi:MAG: hypothetical protein E6K75_09035 [Candidatus Eisenbacteria bacterium]|uniref:Uncharacterized protein n=1 Tax=Eiseniibacteriota bacterium TaxID=2212470 RepID=A0A538SWZ1_UNCEI|nr:MAG: hypothetical protein E6K75_09035 [Candidatus Eisenbacteria bacterium]
MSRASQVSNADRFCTCFFGAGLSGFGSGLFGSSVQVPADPPSTGSGVAGGKGASGAGDAATGGAGASGGAGATGDEGATGGTEATVGAGAAGACA